MPPQSPVHEISPGGTIRVPSDQPAGGGKGGDIYVTQAIHLDSNISQIVPRVAPGAHLSKQN